MRSWTQTDTPLGTFFLGQENDALVMTAFGRLPRDWAGVPQQESRLLQKARRQVDDYFAGKRTGFDLPLSTAGTDFQRDCWDMLQKIPFGSTCTYGDLAEAIGRPKAFRAVGQSNGRNPLPLIIPCHRVVASQGKLGGYTGGLHIKTYLLEHEGASLP